jgi:alkyl sulfatase BDS1-like metallo-beta-lactamase superfamily hydrolase
MTTRRDASAAVRVQHRAALQTLPMSDTADFDATSRGRITELSPGVVRAADDEVVWDNDSYAFLTGDAPDTVHQTLSIDVVLDDVDERYRLRLSNGALAYSSAPQRGDADVTLTLPRASLPAFAQATTDPGALVAAGIEVTGDAGVLDRLFGLLDPGDPNFSIVTPD